MPNIFMLANCIYLLPYFKRFNFINDVSLKLYLYTF